ncbi:unnamed protein product [Amoebophrya sp. A120]|nr:unnamed protein product [Amoebophrya sp. A120]|eukprot:GSA120T00011803001.1
MDHSASMDQAAWHRNPVTTWTLRSRVLIHVQHKFYYAFLLYVLTVILLGAVLLYGADRVSIPISFFNSAHTGEDQHVGHGDASATRIPLSFPDALFYSFSCVSQAGLSVTDWPRSQRPLTHFISLLLMFCGCMPLLALIPPLLRRYDFRKQYRTWRKELRLSVIAPQEKHTTNPQRDDLFGNANAGLSTYFNEESRLEYRALGFLVYVTLVYVALWIVGGFLVLLCCAKDVRPSEHHHDAHWTTVLYAAASAFHNNGLTLSENSFVDYPEPFLIVAGLIVLAGNTMFPVLLRWILVLLERHAEHTNNPQAKEVYQFLLSHPRRVFTHLFPSVHTLWLFLTVFVLNFLCTYSLYLLDARYDWWSCLFQALATRTAGFSCVPLFDLSMATNFLLCVCMYIAASPTIVVMRGTRTRTQTEELAKRHKVELHRQFVQQLASCAPSTNGEVYYNSSPASSFQPRVLFSPELVHAQQNQKNGDNAEANPNSSSTSRSPAAAPLLDAATTSGSDEATLTQTGSIAATSATTSLPRTSRKFPVALPPFGKQAITAESSPGILPATSRQFLRADGVTPTDETATGLPSDRPSLATTSASTVAQTAASTSASDERSSTTDSTPEVDQSHCFSRAAGAAQVLLEDSRHLFLPGASNRSTGFENDLQQENFGAQELINDDCVDITGNNGEDTDLVDQNSLRSQARHYLGKDVAALVILTFCILVAERDRFRIHPGGGMLDGGDQSAFGVKNGVNGSEDFHDTYEHNMFFKVLYEIVSAYGTVGLSLGGGSPENLARGCSFAGSWTVEGKMLLCLVMLLGKMRGLPESIDPSVGARMVPRLRSATEGVDPASQAASNVASEALLGGPEVVENMTVFADGSVESENLDRRKSKMADTRDTP